MADTDQIVPGRACGTCMLCCKLASIPELDKPANKWCRHAAPGRGCTIYDARPGDCRHFHCGWLVDASMPMDWKPEISKFMIFVAGDGSLTVMVDPGAPAAWKDPRYYPGIKRVAAQILDSRMMPTMVIVGAKRFIILPERDVEVKIPEGHGARIVEMENHVGRRTYDVVVEKLPAA
jgi:hypothetical protein